MNFETNVRSGNLLLDSLPADDFQVISGLIEEVSITRHSILQTAHQPIDHAYFFYDGLATMRAVAGGKRIGTARIGREGVIGASLLIGDTVSPFDCLSLTSGSAYRLTARQFLEALQRSGPLARATGKYIQALWIQSSYNTLAGRTAIQVRVARLILMFHDRLTDDHFRITHDIVAEILGVRRPSISTALAELEECEAIRSKNKTIYITDRRQLENAAGGSYGQAESEYLRLLKFPASHGGAQPAERGDENGDQT